MDIVIRDATPADQPIIAAFNSRLAEETEGKTLSPDLIGPGLAAILADSTKGRYWLAFVGGEVAGQIMVTYAWSNWRNGMLCWIQSVYVPIEFRRKVLFSAMYQHVESMVKDDQGACGNRLYIEKSNLQAQDTYRNLGLTEPGYLMMESILPNE